MYSFREIKPIQNNILLRVKFIVESFYTILGKKCYLEPFGIRTNFCAMLMIEFQGFLFYHVGNIFYKNVTDFCKMITLNNIKCSTL